MFEKKQYQAHRSTIHHDTSWSSWLWKHCCLLCSDFPWWFIYVSWLYCQATMAWWCLVGHIGLTFPLRMFHTCLYLDTLFQWLATSDSQLLFSISGTSIPCISSSRFLRFLRFLCPFLSPMHSAHGRGIAVQLVQLGHGDKSHGTPCKVCWPGDTSVFIVWNLPSWVFLNIGTPNCSTHLLHLVAIFAEDTILCVLQIRQQAVVLEVCNDGWWSLNYTPSSSSSSPSSCSSLSSSAKIHGFLMRPGTR